MSDTQIECARCGQTAVPPARVPYGGEVGDAIRTRTCATCWDEWLKMEVMVINELRLNFMDPESQDILVKQLREFLNLDGGTPGDGPSATIPEV